MKPVPSPLSILDFAITKMNFELVLDRVETSLTHYFPSYAIDIDFDMYKNEDLKVFIRLHVNQSSDRLPGYSFSAEAACFFALDNRPDLTEQQRMEIEGFSTIYIALNSLRGLVSNFTANAPFGKYILPSIDLNDLIKKKQLALTAHETLSTNKKQTKTVKNTKKKKTEVKK